MKRIACFVVILIVSFSFAPLVSAQDKCCPAPQVPFLNAANVIVCGTQGFNLVPVEVGPASCPVTFNCDIATNFCINAGKSKSSSFTPSMANFVCGGGQGVNTALGCIPTDPTAFVTAFFPWALGIAGTAAFLLIIFGAFQHITAAGNPEQMQKAQELIVSALTGLVIIIFSVSLLKIIGVDILKLPFFEAMGGG